MSSSNGKFATGFRNVTYSECGIGNMQACEIEEKHKAVHSSNWRHLWSDFVASTTLHGIRYIFFDETYILRRLLWVFLTLSCSTLMCYQIIDRIIYYRENPVNVNVKINYNTSLNFPAVTICNQNAFKATAAYQQNWYRLIESMYNGTSEFLTKQQLEYFKVNNLTMNAIFQNTSHRKEDLIVNCHWSGQPCGPENFTEHLTDYGYCYRFVASESAKSTGADNGLNLLLNVEQYEYMPGPNDAAGVKVLTHNENEHPRVRELGIAVPTGTHAFIGLKMIFISNLPIPHGQCRNKTLIYFDEYTYDSCMIECYTKEAERKCGCRDFYMPHKNNSPPACNLERYFHCLKPLYEHLLSVKNECDCPTACDYILYDPVLSYATTSEYAGQKLMDNIDVKTIQSKLARSREVTNRMETRKLAGFRQKIHKVNETFQKIKELIHGEIQHRVGEQIRQMTSYYKSVLKASRRRTWLLAYQTYNVQKNFMRGRDAMEERTLSHLCNSFHEFVFAIETNFRTIVSKNVSDDSVRQGFFITTLNMVENRLENARRAIANYTVLINAFETGKPIFRYKFRNVPRRYNTFIVPRPLLNESTSHNQYARRYSRKLGKDIEIIMNSLNGYYLFTQEVYEDKFLNIPKMNNVSEEFIDACEDYYQTKSTLYFETVDRPERILLSRKLEFDKHVAEVKRVKSAALNNLENLQTTVASVTNKSLVKIESAIQNAQRYFTDSQKSKFSLIDQFLSGEFIADVTNIKIFLQEVLSRGANVFDSWIEFADKVNYIWKDILNDQDMQEYYVFRNYSDFLRNYTNVSENIISEFERIRNDNDLRFITGDVDVLFFSSVEILQKDLDDFGKSTIFNYEVLKENFLEMDIFYRQLSYEEINQQRAYDIFSLLCDIGGSMGLFIGGSVLSMFELFDLIGTYLADRTLKKQTQNKFSSETQF